jgi:NTP pyrophosphatase (non-canonical NTP hydrolase)
LLSGETARVTIEQITFEIRAFRDERHWKQFHNPKEMAVAIAVEAGELLEHFTWKTAEQSEQCVKEKRGQIAEEMADVAILLFEMADNVGVNLTEAIRAKLAKNAEKYPVSKARGSNRKYNEL